MSAATAAPAVQSRAGFSLSEAELSRRFVVISGLAEIHDGRVALPDMAAVYLERAAECLRMAKRAGGTAEKASWLEMHESWLRLAKDRNAAPVERQPLIDGFAHPPTEEAE